MSRNKAIFAGKRGKFRKQICQEEKLRMENGEMRKYFSSCLDQKRATCILQISMHKTGPGTEWPKWEGDSSVPGHKAIFMFPYRLRGVAMRWPALLGLN